ncbi:MAG: thioredoxin family protein [Saprospiraceae bacterium]
MKKFMLLAVAGLMLCSFVWYQNTSTKEVVIDNSTIKWYTLEEAMEAQKTNPKKLMIDVYTDWCGWCKVMDQKTFTDPSVIQHLNESYYAVKFNAEQKDPITFQGKTYSYLNGGKRGIHEFAYALLDRKASYPSFVVLNDELQRVGVIKGFKTPADFMQKLQGFQAL